MSFSDGSLIVAVKASKEEPVCYSQTMLNDLECGVLILAACCMYQAFSF